MEKMKILNRKDGSVDYLIRQECLIGCVRRIYKNGKILIRVRGPVKDLKRMAFMGK